MLKFEIITHFCHYAEELVAFLYPCHEANPSFNSADILENLTKYRVYQIDNFYQDFKDDYALDGIKRDNFNRLFGYDRIKPDQGVEKTINLSLTSIQDAIKAVPEFYNFWKDSYNAYKHGYRLWFGYEEQHILNVVLYLEDTVNRFENRMEYLPIDDETIATLQNLVPGVYLLDVIVDMSSSGISGVYETVQ